MSKKWQHLVIVAGGRDYNDFNELDDVLTGYVMAHERNTEEFVEIVSGMARGADKLAYNWATTNQITVHEYPADWNKYGKSAGYRRNEEMAEVADHLIAFWDGKSRGTKHMIDIMQRKGKSIQIVWYGS